VQIGAAVGGTLAAGLLATFGSADFRRRLIIEGIPSERTQDALTVLDTLLDPATADAVLADPSIAERLIVGYQATYLAALDRVLLILALICAVGGAVAWLGLRPRSSAEPEATITD
jgi:hypothetical protein